MLPIGRKRGDMGEHFSQMGQEGEDVLLLISLGLFEPRGKTRGHFSPRKTEGGPRGRREDPYSGSERILLALGGEKNTNTTLFERELRC